MTVIRYIVVRPLVMRCLRPHSLCYFDTIRMFLCRAAHVLCIRATNLWANELKMLKCFSSMRCDRERFGTTGERNMWRPSTKYAVNSDHRMEANIAEEHSKQFATFGRLFKSSGLQKDGTVATNCWVVCSAQNIQITQSCHNRPRHGHSCEGCNPIELSCTV